LPALRLNEDGVQAETIFLDDSIDATVTGLTNALSMNSSWSGG
jgi:hypothetical protein